MKLHVIYYIVLIVILALGTLMFFYENGNHTAQLAIGIVTSLSYVVWGIIHHTTQNDLHRKVVVEYILIGAIAIALFVIILSP